MCKLNFGVHVIVDRWGRTIYVERLLRALTAEVINVRVLEHSSLTTLTVEGHCGIFVVNTGALDLQERMRCDEVRAARHAVLRRLLRFFICTVCEVCYCIPIVIIEVVKKLRLSLGGTKLMLRDSAVIRIALNGRLNSDHLLFRVDLSVYLPELAIERI